MSIFILATELQFEWKWLFTSNLLLQSSHLRDFRPICLSGHRKAELASPQYFTWPPGHLQVTRKIPLHSKPTTPPSTSASPFFLLPSDPKFLKIKKIINLLGQIEIFSKPSTKTIQKKKNGKRVIRRQSKLIGTNVTYKT